jgi:hypothetical protein
MMQPKMEAITWHVVWGGKKRLSTREKFKGYLHWNQCCYQSATEFSRYDATSTGRSRGYCLLTILCCIFCRLVFSSFSDFCFYVVS